MNAEGLSELAWFKSSYSSGEGGQCVEIALRPSTIHIRDSKQDPSSAPTVTLSPSAWKAFLSAIS